MTTLTIRRLDDRTHALLRERAARNGRSVEAEVRAILSAAVDRPATNVLLAVHECFWPDGGVDIVLPERHDAPREVDLA